MKAIRFNGTGGPEVMELVNLETPSPGAGEVLIRVAAAGVNRPDIVQRLGGYPPPAGAPETPGLEVSGTVEVVGDDVEGPSVGDSVCALVPGGGYAEYCIAPVETVLPVPDGLSMEHAAAIPETFFTVWSNVFGRAHLDRGESLLVHGGTSGIGTAAIQLAKAFDARVFATAGTDEKCVFCEQLGADMAVNYKTQDFVEMVLGATDGKGVNVVLDMVGGDYVPRNIKCLSADGRLVNIAFLRGPKTEVNLLPVMLKRLTLTGSTLRPRSNAFKGAIAHELRTLVWPLFESGEIAPVLDQIIPLTDAARAHERMEAGAHIGNMVLKP